MMTTRTATVFLALLFILALPSDATNHGRRLMAEQQRSLITNVDIYELQGFNSDGAWVNLTVVGSDGEVNTYYANPDVNASCTVTLHGIDATAICSLFYPFPADGAEVVLSMRRIRPGRVA